MPRTKYRNGESHTYSERKRSINFNKSALLIIKGESTSGILSMTKDIKIDNKRIYINIAIVHGYTTVMEKWIVGYVIPNNIEIEDISFNIDYREYSAD